jgi:hypothetical protein
LEDISHLFLSNRIPGSALSDPTPDRTALSPAPPEAETAPPAPRTVILRRQPHLSRDQLRGAVAEFAGVLEDGLRPIDTRVPSDPSATDIDVVAVDRAHQLVLIDVDTTADDALLLRATSHFDWVTRNMANVRRMFQGHVIDFAQPPRLVLVAPAFSPLMKRAARHMSRPHITWKRYLAVDLAGNTGLLLEDDTD